MDVIGPVQAALAAKQAKGPRREPVTITCRHCRGAGEIVMPPRRLNIFSPSGISYCERQLYFQYLGIPGIQRWDLNERLMMDIGHKIHELWQEDYLAPLFAPDVGDSPVMFSYEDNIEIGEWDVFGSSDGLFVGPNFRVGLEIKSASSKTIAELGEKPSNAYLLQNAAYNWGMDVPGSIFLYVEKAYPHQIVQIFNGYDPILVEHIQGIITDVRNHMEVGTTPDITVSSYDCRKCVYNHACRYGSGEL